MLAQGFSQRPAAVLAQGKQPAVTEHEQRAQRCTVFMDNAQSGFCHPCVVDQREFEHRQRDAFFFQFDDSVKAPE